MMSEKRSKYDTDPLDPNFVRRTDEIMGNSPSPSATTTGDVASTRPTEPVSPQMGVAHEDPTRRLEEPTRRLEEPLAGSYPSVFVPPVYQPPAINYTPYGRNVPPHAAQTPRTPAAAQGGKPTSRHVAGLGLPENLAMVLPYAPFYIGIVASLIELLLVPRSEHRVRFHAAQGLALQLSIVAIGFLFFILSMITDSNFGGWLFSLAAFIFLIVSIFRVWQGERHLIAPLEDVTGRINQQIEPRKQ
jgi:uncharacterized membrane protein